jgi:hypothetical protein
MKRVALFYPDGRNNLAELGQGGQAGNTKVLMLPFATPCAQAVAYISKIMTAYIPL